MNDEIKITVLSVPLSAPTEHNNDFFVTQLESVQLYNQLLNGFESETKTYAGQNKAARQKYPEYYGESYIDEKTGELIVLVKDVETDNLQEIKNFTSQSSLVTCEQCEVSYNVICEVMECLINRIDYILEQGTEIKSISEDIINGKVVVAIHNMDTRDKRLIQEIVACDFIEFVHP